MHRLPVLLLGLLLVAGCLDDGEPENSPPVARAELETPGTSFEPGRELGFSAAGSSDPDDDPLEFYWDFDANDGSDQRIKGVEVTWTYYAEGSYTVTLTASDGEDTASDTLTVLIAEPPSSVKAVITSPDDGGAKDNDGDENGVIEAVAHPDDPVTIRFAGDDSTTSEGEILKYEWDFSYDSGEGFQVDDDTGSDAETSHDFESGIYLVALRATNDQDDSDQTYYADSLWVRVNFNASYTRTIGSGSHSYDLPVVSMGVESITVRLEYDDDEYRSDLDLFLYNLTGEEVARNDTHDTSQNRQVNLITLDADNETDAEWFDEESELGAWEVEVEHQRSWGDDPEYKLWLDVRYWE